MATTQPEREAIAASARQWRCFGQTVEGDLENERVALIYRAARLDEQRESFLEKKRALEAETAG